MFQNERSDFFLTVEYSIEGEEVYINMTLKGIEFLIDVLNSFSKENEIIVNDSEFTRDNSVKNCKSASKILINYQSIETQDLAINVVDDEASLYIFCSEKGMNKFIDSLICLKEGLENGQPEDISYMVEEWGGEWLLNKKFIEGSIVICHLRLYGILG